MDNEEKKDEKGCCSTKKCCCGGKALAVLALLVVGALGGYLLGRHCAMCPLQSAPAAVQAPAK